MIHYNIWYTYIQKFEQDVDTANNFTLIILIIMSRIQYNINGGKHDNNKIRLIQIQTR